MNCDILIPAPPHPDVSPSECRACGAVRDRRRPAYKPVRWSDGLVLFQSSNRNNGDRWVSRGPVLHCMRVIALERWYGLHQWCHLRGDTTGGANGACHEDTCDPDRDRNLDEHGQAAV